MKFILIDHYVLLVNVCYFRNNFINYLLTIGFELTSTNQPVHDLKLLNEEVSTSTLFQHLPSNYKTGLYKQI